MNSPHDIPSIPFIIKGQVVEGNVQKFNGFSCPSLELDDLVWLRSEPGPAFDTPIAEIIDFLVATGEALDFDRNVWMQQALELSLQWNPLGRRILETAYRTAGHFFNRTQLEFQLGQELGVQCSDGWAPIATPGGRISRVRAFPPRLVHVLAGNTPAVAVVTIVRGALTKGVHLLKLPANDLLTASAILQTMRSVDENHPVVRSFSAAYWRGGDTSIESAIMRPQFFDKLVVWGGEASVRNALRYAGPGLEVVSFDPKISMSFVGREAHASEASQLDAAERAATDVSIFNQDACAASRFVYAEGTLEQVDGFCQKLSVALTKERPLSSAFAQPLSTEMRDEIDCLKMLDPVFRVWGAYDGSGVVIRSDSPVDFYPVSKTVNVVMVDSLEQAVQRANVATQTVGVYPPSRVASLRNALASMGVQRIVALGEVAAHSVEGLPHDGFYPLRRFVRWLVDDATSQA